MGYAGAQLGTRFIATTECTAHPDYKRAIVDAAEDDIVLTERVTGVPLAVIRTPYVERVGTKAGPIARWLLRHRRTKHFMRTLYALNSAWRLKRANFAGPSSRDYWQAGKSVSGITSVEPAGEIVRQFAAAARAASPGSAPAARGRDPGSNRAPRGAGLGARRLVPPPPLSRSRTRCSPHPPPP